MSLTSEEMAMLNKLGEAFCLFHALPVMHPADLGDFVFHVHALQNIVMSRSAMRCHPDVFPDKTQREVRE